MEQGRGRIARAEKENMDTQSEEKHGTELNFQEKTSES